MVGYNDGPAGSTRARAARELRLFSDAGRCCRPILIVEDQSLLLKKEHIDKLRDKVEARCASTIQREVRARHAALMASVRAAVTLQAAARRMMACRETSWHRERRDAANILQQAALRRGYVRELAEQRALTLEAEGRMRLAEELRAWIHAPQPAPC